MFRSFVQFMGERRANVALMSAVMMLPLLGLICGAVDFARYSTAQAQLRSALATGVEGARPLTSRDHIRTVVTSYVLAGVGESIEPGTIEISVPAPDDGGMDVDVVVQAEMRTLFLRIVGIDTLKLREDLQATLVVETFRGVVSSRLVDQKVPALSLEVIR